MEFWWVNNENRIGWGVELEGGEGGLSEVVEPEKKVRDLFGELLGNSLWIKNYKEVIH